MLNLTPKISQRRQRKNMLAKMLSKEGCLTSRWSSFGSDSSIVSALISWRCRVIDAGMCCSNWLVDVGLICEACKLGRLMKRRLVMMQYWKSWMYWSYLDIQFFEKSLFRMALCFLDVFFNGCGKEMIQECCFFVRSILLRWFPVFSTCFKFQFIDVHF